MKDFTKILNYVIMKYFNLFSCIYLINEDSNVDFHTAHPIIILDNSDMGNYLEEFKCEGFIVISDQVAQHLISIEAELWRNITINRYTKRRYMFISTNVIDVRHFLKHRNFKFIMDAVVVVPKRPLEYHNDLVMLTHTLNVNVGFCYEFWTHRFMSLDPPTLLYTWCTNTTIGCDIMYTDKMKVQEIKKMDVSAIHHKPYVDMKTGRGVELLMVKTFLKHYNFSSNIVKDVWGYVYKNFTGVGSKNHTLNGYTDISVGRFYPLLRRHTYFEISTATVKNGLSFLVPPPRLETGLATPFRPFSSTVWALFLTVVITAAVVNYCLFYIHSRMYLDGTTVSVDQAILEIFGIIFQQSVKIHARLFGTCLLLYGVLYAAFYSSGLSSWMAKPTYLNEIKTINDLEQSSIRIICYSLSDVDKLINEKRYKSFSHRAIKVTNEIKSVFREGKDFALALEHLASGYSLGKYENYITVEEVEGFRVLREDISYENCVILGYKHSVLFPYLNLHIFRVKEAGLDYYWLSEDFQAMNRKFRMYFKYDFSQTVVKLSLRSVEGLFKLLAMGLAVASLLFLCELFADYVIKYIP